MGQAMRVLSEDLGFQDFVLDSQFRTDYDLLLTWLGGRVATDADLEFINRNVEDQFRIKGDSLQTNPAIFVNGKINPFTPEGSQQIFQLSLQWAADRYGANLQSLAPKPSGGGRRLPTAEEIRNSFDLDELTNAANSLNRAFLVEEQPKARAWAKAFIDENVKARGQKDIDFETFITTRMKGESRWNQVYRNKPPGLDERQYITPYVAAAQAALGGGDISGVVGGGAALGSSGATFAANLQRESAVQNTSGFISNLERTVSGVKNLLRG